LPTFLLEDGNDGAVKRMRYKLTIRRADDHVLKARSGITRSSLRQQKKPPVMGGF